jgi:2-succinyl-6-hydroxy-2,4-cyclohexadiene-1-carboxylate synthase
MPEIELDGLRYYVEECGTGRPLVLLHGFTGSGRSWQPLIPELATRHRVIAIDLPGHGRSGAPADQARIAFSQVIDDLAAVARELGIDRAAWAGYSMGGRVALALAIEHPSLVSALILESASPGLADPAGRTERRLHDEALAASIERDGVPRFVAQWERLPLWASLAALPEEARSLQRDIRLNNSPCGLAGSLRGMGTGSQPSYWERLPGLERPVLLLAGQHDTRFAHIATEMNAALPNAHLEIVPNAGHAIHLEQPRHYLTLATQFMDEVHEYESHVAKEEVA